MSWSAAATTKILKVCLIFRPIFLNTKENLPVHTSRGIRRLSPKTATVTENGDCRQFNVCYIIYYITLNLEWKMPKHFSHFTDTLKFTVDLLHQVIASLSAYNAADTESAADK